MSNTHTPENKMHHFSSLVDPQETSLQEIEGKTIILYVAFRKTGNKSYDPLITLKIKNRIIPEDIGKGHRSGGRGTRLICSSTTSDGNEIEEHIEYGKNPWFLNQYNQSKYGRPGYTDGSDLYYSICS